jgi:hypothetical protein
VRENPYSASKASVKGIFSLALKTEVVQNKTLQTDIRGQIYKRTEQQSEEATSIEQNIRQSQQQEHLTLRTHTKHL